jgi:hypothetical protein
MRKIFSFLIVPAVMIAVVMSSCKKDDPLKELEITLKDNTENTYTIKVTDYQTGNAISGAILKDIKGETVTTTDDNGMAAYTEKAGDRLIYMLEAAGYASMWWSEEEDEWGGGNIRMSKLDAKLKGVATYTDKNGNFNVVPSGTDITITIGNWYLEKTYTTKVGAEGGFEFSSLPYGVYYTPSQITIGNDKYEISSYFWGFIGSTEPLILNYKYAPPYEIPLAVIAYPSSITPAGNIVIKFSKAVNTALGEVCSHYGYSSNCYVSFTKNWSDDKKTLTLTPDSTPWGIYDEYWYSTEVYNYVWISVKLYSLINESIEKELYIRVVE